jgi:hypothetical protein
MQDPKYVVNPDNLDITKTMVKIMQEDCLKIMHSLLTFSEEHIGKPISPAVIGVAWGWFYYASVFNHINKGDFTLEEFNRFDAALKADTKQGAEEAAKRDGIGAVLFLAGEDDVETELNKVLESLGLSPLPKAPEGGNLH